eukprot:COSAG01_NODE_30752_length_610_cov_0.835616_2_plen_112_part_00
MDTEDLHEISAAELIRNVKRSRVLVLLLTKEALTRPWVLLEIYTAIDSQIPILPIAVDEDPGSCIGNVTGLLQDMEQKLFDNEYMRRVWGVRVGGRCRCCHGWPIEVAAME